MARQNPSKKFVGTADTPKPSRKSTAENQARSADNSRTHGCTSRKTLLPGESPAEFERLWQTTLDRYQATSEFDLNRIEDVVNAEWRKRRSERTLNEYEAKLHAQQSDPGLWTEDQNKRLQLFRRYYTSDNNYFQKTLKLLESLKKNDRNNTLVNHRIADQILDDLRRPASTQKSKRKLLEGVDKFPFPTPDTPATCSCPPCSASHQIHHWYTNVLPELKAKRNEQPTPETN